VQMLMLSESNNAKNMLYPRQKVSGEESTDEGSTNGSSDNESAVLPVAKSRAPESFSRSALRARGEAALARLQAKSQNEEAVASPPPTDRTQWSSECTQWSPENVVGEQDWSQDAWDANCSGMMGFEPLCPWERQPWGTVDPWGNSVSGEAEHFASLSPPVDVGITQSYKDDPIFQLLERSSSGHPVKVLISGIMSSSLPDNQRHAGVPVKKRPPFPECAGSCKALDPSVPAKKRMPTFLLEAMSAY
jgi:hypothetical protein